MFIHKISKCIPCRGKSFVLMRSQLGLALIQIIQVAVIQCAIHIKKNGKKVVKFTASNYHRVIPYGFSVCCLTRSIAPITQSRAGVCWVSGLGGGGGV